MTRVEHGYASNDGIELFTTIEGSAGRSAVLLVNGSGSTSVMWTRSLVAGLLDAGHCVVRFDSRDIGRSTRLSSRAIYTLSDMAADALAVLDHWGLDVAHVIGRSMGGSVAIEMALAQSERVASLTLIYSSAALMASADGLPSAEARVLEAAERAAFSAPPADDAERIARHVVEAELFGGTRFAFDADWARSEAESDAAHAPHAEHGHGGALLASPSRVADLPQLQQRTLVLHGTADPVVPVAHGRLLAQRLPNATLIEYDGLGHELPPAWCREILPPLLDHLAARASS